MRPRSLLLRRGQGRRREVCRDELVIAFEQRRDFRAERRRLQVDFVGHGKAILEPRDDGMRGIDWRQVDGRVRVGTVAAAITRSRHALPVHFAFAQHERRARDRAPQRPQGPGDRAVIEHDDAGSAIDQRLDAAPVVLGRRARVPCAVVHQPDAGNPRHVVEEHGVVNPHVLRPQDDLCRRLLDHGHVDVVHLLEHRQERIVIERMPFRDEKHSYRLHRSSPLPDDDNHPATAGMTART